MQKSALAQHSCVEIVGRAAEQIYSQQDYRTTKNNVQAHCRVCLLCNLIA